MYYYCYYYHCYCYYYCYYYYHYHCYEVERLCTYDLRIIKIDYYMFKTLFNYSLVTHLNYYSFILFLLLLLSPLL